MEVNDPNKSNALCASYEHVLADEKKNLDSKKMAREEKRRGREQCGSKSAWDESKDSSFKCLTL